MSVYDRDDEYKLFKRRLRREARQSRPAFSDDLHARLTFGAPAKATYAAGVLARTVRGCTRRCAAKSDVRPGADGYRFDGDRYRAGLVMATPQAARDDIVVRNTPTNTPGVVHDATGVPSWQLIPRDVATSDADDIDSMTEDLARSASGIGDWARAWPTTISGRD